MSAGTARKGGIAGWWHRLTATSETIEAEQAEEAAKQCGAVPVGECRNRSKVKLRGKVLSIAPTDGGLEAQFADGSGQVRLFWMGRRKLDCVSPGKTLVVCGRLSEEDGQATIFNPDFEVVSATEAR